MKLLRRFISFPDLKTGDNIQRFYKLASVAKVEAGYQVQLDGRGIYTPEKLKFILPTEVLALGVATEWQSQDKLIFQHRMPLVISKQMNLAATAVDLAKSQLRPVLVHRLLNTLRNDSIWYELLSYREEEEPMKRKQDDLLNPLIDYLAEKNIVLPKCVGITIPNIPESSIESFEKYCDVKDNFFIVALEAAATVSKSVAVAICLLEERISVETAVACARLEENLQAEEFGKVDGTHDVDESYTVMVMAAAQNLTRLARS